MKKRISFVMCLLLVFSVYITVYAEDYTDIEEPFSEEYSSDCEEILMTESESDSYFSNEDHFMTDSEDCYTEDESFSIPGDTAVMPEWEAFQHVSVTFFVSVNSLASVSYHAVAHDSSSIEATIYIEKLVFGIWQRVDIGTNGNKLTNRTTGSYISGTETVKVSGDGTYRAVVSVKNSYGSGSSSATFIFSKSSSLADVNNDGSVTAVDARLALRFSANLQKYTSDQKKRCDVNGDSNITAADARIILRISAKLM